MTDLRNRRQRVLADLIRNRLLSSQEDVVGSLADAGFIVTQATVSRDLDQLGAIKTKRGGVIAYALPDQMAVTDWATRRLATIISEWVRSVDQAGNLVVLKTPPGSAHLVGVALDQAALEPVIGTICGDDTLFLAVATPAAAAALVKRFAVMTATTE